jgi:hypothetical protein
MKQTTKKQKATEAALVQWFRQYRPASGPGYSWVSRCPEDVVAMYRARVQPFDFGDVGAEASDVEIHSALTRFERALADFQQVRYAVFTLDYAVFRIRPHTNEKEPIRHAGELIETLRAGAKKAAQDYKRRGRGKRAVPGLDRLLNQAAQVFVTVTGSQPSERAEFLHLLDIMIQDKIPALHRETLGGYRRIVRNWINTRKAIPAQPVRKSRN